MKIALIFGTRPEAIKMAPIVKELKKQEDIETVVCVTGQHREMLDQVLEVFDIKPDYDLDIFKPGQSLTDITVNSLEGIEKVLAKEKPDVLLVQGDTTTVFSGALAAFYQQIKIGHVEAGLRTGNIYSPYPEEANRKMVGTITNYHFCPTDANRQNLLREGYKDSDIYITGNTVIDALKYTVQEDYVFEDQVLNDLDYDRDKIILLTSHRRENLGQPMRNIFTAVKDEIKDRPEVKVVFPIHLNPKVRQVAYEVFEGMDQVIFVEPLDYLPFTNLMNKVYLVMTDSGGVQEEAPSLGKPILVLRKETERMEGVEANTARLVGTDYQVIRDNLRELLDDKEAYNKMAKSQNPYGDGTAAKQIVEILKNLKN
ncbi:MAG: UDP-N-acetylglucosamine 2-epimerase (non-hydrolyzing) [Bacillota bacterium]|nr:UDP-N-acetylglucosamine 2-epimerase (non-hydrolyzing) [Bacillota bacterium]